MRPERRGKQFSMIADAQVKKFVGDDVVLEAGRLLYQVTAEGDPAL